jgi:hypothetical protein
MIDLDGLPGTALVRRGLTDLARQSLSVEALVVAIASTRLRELGIELRDESLLPPDRELALYAKLGDRGEDDPYTRYNSLRRELDSFLEALEGRRRREASRLPR